MKTITMLEFRQNMPAIVRGLRKTGGVKITHRGKYAATLLPPQDTTETVDFSDDPIYRLGEFAVAGTDDDATMTNEKIDQILYGWNRPCDP